MHLLRRKKVYKVWYVETNMEKLVEAIRIVQSLWLFYTI